MDADRPGGAGGGTRGFPAYDVSWAAMHPRANAIPLAELPIGGWGRVCAAENGAALGLRLLALGFVPGTRVGMIRRAPFGGPVELELRGYRLCLRLRQLDGLRVVPEGAAERG